MQSSKDTTLKISTAMTMETVEPLLLESQRWAIRGATVVVDLAEVGAVDSSALSVIFEWMRQAKHSHGQLVFTHLPSSLVSLAKLYGVLDIIPQQAVSQH